MKKFIIIANYWANNKRNVFLFLLIFHSLLSIFLFFIAQSDILSGLHNGKGFWNFARDVETYHNEANFLLYHLNNHEWSAWWNLYSDHKHVRLASFLYWISGYHQPIVYELINSLVWALSVILIFNSAEILFSNNKISLLSVSFFFLPTVLLSSTQMLRDPIFTLGFCLLCYGSIALISRQLKLKSILIIQIGLFLIISMRDYLSPVFLLGLIIFSIIVLVQRKISIFQVFILILPLILFENFTTNKHLKDTSQLSLDNQEQILMKAKDIENSINKDKKEFVELSTINQKASAEMKALIEEKDANIDQQQLKIREQTQIIKIAKIELDFASNESNESLIRKAEAKIENAKKKQSMAIFEQKRINTEFLKKQQTINFEQARAIENLQLIDIDDSFISKNLDVISRKISTLRYGFQNNNLNAGSKIDGSYLFLNFTDIVEYLPRALQIGFFAPFPTNWYDSGVQVGRIGNILAGIEMFIWYLVLFGYVFTVLKQPYTTVPLLHIIFISIIIITLMTYAIPNIGAIYRMRQPYMIPFYIFGVYGLSLIYNIIKNR